ncbi:MAG: DUF305 domain-containing protein [Actinobacteria bacterium]|nr:DUF305 domain-containing protein [Actinomycetota bacterium]
MPVVGGEVDPEPGFFNLPRVIALVLTVAFIAGVIGWRIGEPDAPDLSDVDIGFLSDMTTHHSGALTLGFAYLSRDNDATVAHIAREIVTDQSIEINFMTRRLALADDDERVAEIAGDDVAMEWMGERYAPTEMPGLATTDELDELRSLTGTDADDLFSRLMIDHHTAGIEMATYEAEHGSDEATRRAARAMAEVQRREVNELNAAREELGLEAYEPETDPGHSHA